MINFGFLGWYLRRYSYHRLRLYYFYLLLILSPVDWSWHLVANCRRNLFHNSDFLEFLKSTEAFAKGIEWIVQIWNPGVRINSNLSRNSYLNVVNRKRILGLAFCAKGKFLFLMPFCKFPESRTNWPWYCRLHHDWVTSMREAETVAESLLALILCNWRTS